jgi:two-component system, NtrC family, nitrogen regulation sensor histidine kinase NtrY
VTLAQRLLLAIGVLTVATTAALGLGVRAAWRNAEEESFKAQFKGAVERLETDLAEEIRELPSVLAPLCEHDQVIDSAFLDLARNELDAGRRLALSLRVPELAKALKFDELVLVTTAGEVLGASPDTGRAGSRDPKLARRIAGDRNLATVRLRDGPPAIEVHCTHSSGGIKGGFYGARRLDAALARVGTSQGLSLSLSRPSTPSDVLVGTMTLPQLPGLSVFATRSRLPLRQAIIRLDTAILAIGAMTLAAGLLFAILLSRGLAKPIVRLSEQARRVVTGDPVPVEAHGGRELEQFAAAFNQAIADLVALRKRLAATERIAARREIARQVAHEIKNPLAPIRAAVETLRRLRDRHDPAFDDYFDEATRTVLAEVARIADIVREFTEFARLPPPNPAPMDLERAVRDVVGLHATAGPRILVSVSEIPELVADKNQLIQILTNLVQNALDAVASTKDPKVVVEIARHDAHHIRLAVRDNGPGVAAEMRGRLFEPYATTKEHGTGLGLAIVERIVIEHGGEIRYGDAPGGGAEFTIVLPKSGPTLLTEPPPASGAEGSRGPGV